MCVINEGRAWDVLINSVWGSLCCPEDDWSNDDAKGRQRI